LNAVGEMTSILRLADGVTMSTDTGYADVLGERDAVGSLRGQQMFRKKALALVYERIWRPAASRTLFGLRGPGAAKESRITMDMLGVSAGDRVLDVGCGPGNYTRRLAAVAGEGLTVGVDASEAMIAAASKRGSEPNLAYLRCDACSLPFADEAFDAACSVGVIHMLDEPLAAVGEMVRVLKPGGRLVIVASCAQEARPRRDLGFNARRERSLARSGVTVFARDELTSALRERGTVDLDQRIVGHAQFVAARKAEA
jgi:SAM-dependent methyltransferase